VHHVGILYGQNTSSHNTIKYPQLQVTLMSCMFRNGEDARIWKKTVVGYLKVVYVHSLTANAEKHMELHLGQTINQVVLRTAYLLNANRHSY